MEILAPAGNEQSLVAAVRSGADAVYLGTGAFNARRNADNFKDNSLAEAVNYCHGRGVKVYVTLNTLIRDEELPAFLDAAREVAQAGPDGVIVQDLAVVKVLKTICPDLPLVGSTQMSVHNAAGVRALEDMGFSRVVLARELTLEEIRTIRAETRAELEVFVHGALCMSVSGMCYYSAMMGERSGNRGLCAQPCRLNSSCNGRPYALSLKDMSFITRVRDLAAAGVCSVKIEGRMKRPEYVAAAVTAVKAALNGEQPDMATLQAVFSRSGFTDGYLTGKRNVRMFGVRTVEDAAASKTVFGRLAELYRREYPGVPVDLSLTVGDDVLSLTAADEAGNVAQAAAPIQRADMAPLTEDIARRNLGKTGGTPFTVRSCRVDLPEGLPVPGSVVNGLRREALDQLLEMRSRGNGYALHAMAAPETRPRSPGNQTLRLRFERAEQVFFASGIEAISLPFEQIEQHPALLAESTPLWAELPQLVWPLEEQTILDRLLALKEKGLRDAVAQNVCELVLARRAGLTVHGGPTLNISNTLSLETYEAMGLADATLSFELPLKMGGRLGGERPRGILGYGRFPIMQFRACPARGEQGCGGCAGRPELVDRKGVVFPMICHDRRYTTLLNSVPLYLGDKSLPPFDFVTLYFTTEDRKTCQQVYEGYRKGAAPWFDRTSGLAFRTLL
ncbi:MAG: U32 family peptidase [Clostridia bacterium]|nr:U32 family peptidase [Clostridia bacterium]